MVYQILGAHLFTRAAHWFGTSHGGKIISKLQGNPFIQSGQFGLGYTGSAYLGYASTNLADPLGLHNKTNKRPHQTSLGLPYGRSYGRRRYTQYSGYTRYGRPSYYRRRRAYYRRRSYY